MSSPIEIPLPIKLFQAIDGKFSLCFDDVKQAEAFADYIKAQCSATRTQRLEFFDDGIYLDGKRLEIKGLMERFLREFEYTDEVSETTLAYNVWGDSTVSSRAIYLTADRIRRATNIWIERDGVIYRIDRPK